MHQIRFHGRGGQGVVTSAELLSTAAFLDGRHAQAFPMFGSERTGAPIQAFCRVGDAPIRAHEPIVRPDVLIVQDATLLHHVDLFTGLAADGLVLINSPRHAAGLGLADLAADVRTVPASAIATEHLGRSMPGTALLGALAAATSLVSRASLVSAVRMRFTGAVADGNVQAIDDGWTAIEACAYA